MAGKLEGDDHLSLSFDPSFDNLLLGLRGALATGSISREEYISSYVDIAMKIQQALIEYQQQAARKTAEELGIETLTPESADKRSAAWFDETGKPFVTGVAVTCLAVAITHPDVGMTAAHYNILNRPVMEHALDILVTKPPTGGSTVPSTNVPDGRRLSKLASDDHLSQLAGKTVGEALGLFRELEPTGDIPDGTEVSLIGLDFISTSGKQAVIGGAIQTFEQVIPALPSSNRESMDVKFHEYLGQEGGIIYGGKNHPKYPAPQTYRFS